ncbi:hypothetical protein GCM10009650_20200 [Nesterenkonia jeotgali]
MSETDQRQDRAGEWAVPLRAEEVACWLLLMMLLPEWGRTKSTQEGGSRRSMSIRVKILDFLRRS